MRSLATSVVVAFFSQKGGNGKSTMAVHLAVELMFRGWRVTLVDTDSQGSVSIFNDIAHARGQLRPPVVGLGVDEDGMSEGEQEKAMQEMLAAIAELAKHTDFVIVDTSGGLSKRSVTALEAADIAVLPCLPSPLDFHSLSDTLDAAKEMMAVRPKLQARVLVNCTYRTVLSQQYRQGIHNEAKKAGLPLFKTEISHRTPFKESVDRGRGITTHAPKSPAADELRAFADEIEAAHPRPRPRPGATVKKPAAKRKGLRRVA